MGLFGSDTSEDESEKNKQRAGFTPADRISPGAASPFDGRWVKRVIDQEAGVVLYAVNIDDNSYRLTAVPIADTKLELDNTGEEPRSEATSEPTVEMARGMLDDQDRDTSGGGT